MSSARSQYPPEDAEGGATLSLVLWERLRAKPGDLPRGPARGPPETGKRLLVMSSPSRFLELKVGDKNSDLGPREAKPLRFISS